MDETRGFSIEAGRRHIIERPRLTRLLDQATARVLMLVAPAGYGKTTLAQQWLADKPHGWYRATRASADVAALAVGLAEAASTIVPGAGKRLRERLRVTQEPEREVDVLAELLAEDLASWPPDAWLAIDDYHFVVSSPSDELVNALVELSPVKVLLTGRRRPKWATARRLLYGEHYELGQSALAMTEDEAAAVLAAGGDYQVPGLVAVADGWPAVIGLAGLTAGSLPDIDVPAPLYDFFAEELYSGASPRLREALPLLLIPPSLDREIARHLLGNDSESVIREAEASGFISTREVEKFEFHPLLRRFLEVRLAATLAARTKAARRLARFLIAGARWDEAFSVIERFGDNQLLTTLISHSLDDLLTESRLTTLSRWIEEGAEIGKGTPMTDLVSAELAFRRGQYERAEHLACRAANRFDDLDALRSRALFRAGHSAYFSDRGEDALEYFAEARRAATTSPDELQAIWGQFIASIDLEHADAAKFFSDHSARSGDDIDALLRNASGELIIGIRLTGVGEILSAARRRLELLEQAADPMARSGFVTMFGVALILAAQYDEAYEILNVALGEVERYRLDFSAPHILVMRAAAELGRRNLTEAERQLDEITQMPRSKAEAHVEMSAVAVRARLLIAQGQFDEGAAITAREWSAHPSAAIYGEYLASRGLALACAGRIDEALAATNEAQRVSSQLDARALTTWARAVAALQSNAQASAEIEAGVSFLRSTGHADSFVAAYRGFGPLLTRVRPYMNDVELREILERAKDRAIAAQIGLASPSPTGSVLTPRETEVHRLLAEGKSNREIAKHLFISEATVKVHVSHILEKLGVRTRTEAAVREISRQLQ